MLKRPAAATAEQVLALLPVLWDEVVRLRARVQELEARLGRNSTNRSRPPAPPTGRQRDGQPGHPPYQRLLVAPEQVDQIVAHWPTLCRGCQAPLAPAAVGEAVRHQVTELPSVRAIVTEHRLQHVQCAA